jgi:transcriptional regulator with XRE-family HTH domain
MLTEFGKKIRKIRLDRGLLLKDMANALSYSSSYISAIETGKREVPEDMIACLSKKYKLSANEISELTKAAILSKKQHLLQPNPYDSGDCIAALARGYDKLSPEQLEAIKNILDKKEK